MKKALPYLIGAVIGGALTYCYLNYQSKKAAAPAPKSPATPAPEAK